MMGGEIPLILDKLIMNIYDDYYSFYEEAIILIYVFVCLLHLQLSSVHGSNSKFCYKIQKIETNTSITLLVLVALL